MVEVLGKCSGVRWCRVAQDVVAQVIIAFLAGDTYATRNCRFSADSITNLEALDVGSDLDHFGTGLVTHYDGFLQQEVAD